VETVKHKMNMFNNISVAEAGEDINLCGNFAFPRVRLLHPIQSVEWSGSRYPLGGKL